jgi:hypothetical protein
VLSRSSDNRQLTERRKWRSQRKESLEKKVAFLWQRAEKPPLSGPVYWKTNQRLCGFPSTPETNVRKNHTALFGFAGTCFFAFVAVYVTSVDRENVLDLKESNKATTSAKSGQLLHTNMP